jgi:hypothetical protein
MRVFFPSLATVTLLACTPGNGPLFVSSVQNNVASVGMTGATCISGTGVTSMFLDVAATPAVEVAASISGHVQYFAAQQPLVVGTTRQLASPATRERLIVQRVFLRYASKPAIPGLTATVTDSVPRTLILSSETKGDVQLSVPLFGANAQAKLAALAPSNTDSFQFTATFEIQGVTDPAGAEFRTPPMSIPITLVKSEVTCATPNDQRLKQFSNPAQPARACTFNGLNRRLNTGDCCLKVDAAGDPVIDVNEPGCDVLP